METGTEIINKIHSSSSFYKKFVFPVQAEYSYFSADFGLKMFL